MVAQDTSGNGKTVCPNVLVAPPRHTQSHVVWRILPTNSRFFMSFFHLQFERLVVFAGKMPPAIGINGEKAKIFH